MAWLAYVTSVRYLTISKALSLHTCCRRSFNSNAVDSQSLESEYGVILTLSILISLSPFVAAGVDKPGEESAVVPDEEEAFALAGEELLDPVLTGVLGMFV